jgi:hypothetical protein
MIAAMAAADSGLFYVVSNIKIATSSSKNAREEIGYCD